MLNNSIRLASLISMIVLTSSCSFYRVIPENPHNSQTIKQYEEDGKYLILHRDDEAWHVYDVECSNDSIHAKLDIQLGYHVNYLNPKLNKLNEFSKKKEPDVINSIHIYTTDSNSSYLDKEISIHAGSINKVNSYAYAQAPSRASLIVPIVFIPLIGITALFIHTANHMWDDTIFED